MKLGYFWNFNVSLSATHCSHFSIVLNMWYDLTRTFVHSQLSCNGWVSGILAKNVDQFCHFIGWWDLLGTLGKFLCWSHPFSNLLSCWIKYVSSQDKNNDQILKSVLLEFTCQVLRSSQLQLLRFCSRQILLSHIQSQCYLMLYPLSKHVLKLRDVHRMHSDEP